MTLKIATDHGWPKASDGSDGNALEAFKNERDYIAQSGRAKTTVAAMDWALREINSLDNAKAALLKLLEWNEGIAAGRGNHHPLDHIKLIRDTLNI
jgi:hypothetical protein